jgi:hypothetical protein
MVSYHLSFYFIFILHWSLRCCYGTPHYVSQSVQAIPGVAFHSTLSEVERQLNPMVRKVLWSVAANMTGVPVEKEIRGAALLLVAVAKGDDDRTTLDEYRRSAQHYNQLVDLHDEFLHQLPFPSVDTSTTSNTNNVGETNLSSQSSPVVRLTSAAAKALVHEMERIEALLYQTRVSRRRIT